MSPEQGERTAPEIGCLFERNQGSFKKDELLRLGMLQQTWLPPLSRKGHSGIRLRRFVECILEEILLFPVARTGLRERIRVQAVVDYSRSLGEQ